MKPFTLFEFMDQAWLPGGLRNTLREILESVCSRPFRGYYDWVAKEVCRAAGDFDCRQVVELGAGTARITELAARQSLDGRVKFVPTDSNPDEETFRALERKSAGRIQPNYSPVDLAAEQTWPPGTLVFLSASLHHVPAAARPAVLERIAASADRVLIFEPLRRTAISVGYVLGAVVPGLLLPLTMLPRPGRWRRLLWCWLLPVAPLMFCWDGVITCLRQWSEAEWRDILRTHAERGRQTSLRHTLFCEQASIFAAVPETTSAKETARPSATTERS